MNGDEINVVYSLYPISTVIYLADRRPPADVQTERFLETAALFNTVY